MTDYEHILVQANDGIFSVTLNRPEILNAANDNMLHELNAAFLDFDADDELHVAIIQGAGRAFCSGADVRQRQLRPPEEMKRLGGPGGGAPLNVFDSVNWKPVISAVHGYAIGLGYGLAMGADIVVAAEGTQFQNRETQRGISGAGGWARTWFWSGDRFSNEISLTSRMFTAEEALTHGLINYITPLEDLYAKAEELARQIMENPPLSVRATVRPMRHAAKRFGEDAGYYVQGRALHLTEDFRESATAFMEKRKAVFKGK